MEAIIHLLGRSWAVPGTLTLGPLGKALSSQTTPLDGGEPVDKGSPTLLFVVQRGIVPNVAHVKPGPRGDRPPVLDLALS